MYGLVGSEMCIGDGGSGAGSGFRVLDGFRFGVGFGFGFRFGFGLAYLLRVVTNDCYETSDYEHVVR